MFDNELFPNGASKKQSTFCFLFYYVINGKWKIDKNV